MTWEPGIQKYKLDFDKTNQELLEITGYLEEEEAKYHLYKFLRSNVTFATNLIAGVDLFPFQHLAIKSMLEADYFLGIWSRGIPAHNIPAFKPAKVFVEGVKSKVAV